MEEDVKRLAVSVAGASVLPAVYWLGGGEFIRGPELASLAMFSVWMAAAIYILAPELMRKP
jgi:hypothetical protein